MFHAKHFRPIEAGKPYKAVYVLPI